VVHNISYLGNYSIIDNICWEVCHFCEKFRSLFPSGKWWKLKLSPLFAKLPEAYWQNQKSAYDSSFRKQQEWGCSVREKELVAERGDSKGRASLTRVPSQ